MVKVFLFNGFIYAVLFTFDFFINLIPEWHLLCAFYLIQSVIIYQISYLLRKNTTILSMQVYMINVTTKFLLTGFYTLFMFNQGINDGVTFIYLLMLLYLFHLLFELNVLLTNLRSQNNSPRNKR